MTSRDFVQFLIPFFTSKQEAAINIYSVSTFGQSNTVLIGEQVVEVFEGRTKFSVEQEEDRLRQDVRDEDEERAHEVGHREPLPLH